MSSIRDLMSTYPMLVSAIAATGGGLALVYALRAYLLPKPIPGKKGRRKKLWWAELAEKHDSPIVQFFFPMMQASIVVADYREARDILLRRSKEFIRGQANCDSWIGLLPGHFIAMEDAHPRFKDAKALGKDLMTPSFLHNVSAPSSYEMVMNLIQLWKLKADVAQGSPFDASEDLSQLTFNIMEAAALGVDATETSMARHLAKLREARLPQGRGGPALVEFPDWEESDLLEALHAFENAAGRALVAPSPWLFHVFNNLFSSRLRKARAARKAALTTYIDGARQRYAKDPEAFVALSAVDHMILREAQAMAKANTTTSHLTLELEDGLIGYMIGGQDSTHSTLCFTAKRLAKHQDIQQKLRDVLRAAHPNAVREGRQPTVEEITKTQIHYLDALIQEILRADPRGTIIIFTLNGPTIKGKGFDVPESRRSATSAKNAGGVGDWAETTYSGEEFLPERWLVQTEGGGEEGTYDSMAGPFLSFSSGTRSCWGQRLAYLELKLIITLLVWNFEFGRLPEELDDWKVIEGMFTRPKNTYVRLTAL
ncbi:unnamed protein product [Parascedosporium putredinis]|uniref:Cytochrome P450 n=1 Tax=Parascedosporium putredinis TaxID=1442378 RepID=A0A9P1GZQ6_9PEZI|nr:unnamed protein product [Parascedosporium putredinis]CAI7991902.1 unnamed protein product [Parascedosporium putredinis]